MIQKNCLHLKKTSTCGALKIKPCPENCLSKVTDPEVYIMMLEDMMYYNRENYQAVLELRKEAIAFREKYDLPEVEYDINPNKRGAFNGWLEVYQQSLERRKAGGSSEKDSNAAASMKQKMKDNRPVECKLTFSEREEIKKATQEWEAENGKLEKLGRNPLSRNRVDSYTGEPID